MDDAAVEITSDVASNVSPVYLAVGFIAGAAVMAAGIHLTRKLRAKKLQKDNETVIVTPDDFIPATK